MDIVTVTLDQYLVFGMALARMSGLVVFMPFFGSENFPRTARVAFAALLALVVFPHAQRTLPQGFSMDLYELATLAMRELAVGLVLGQVAAFFFSGLQVAGELIGQQIGFSLANVFDPMMGEETGLISYLQLFLGLVIFVSLDLHLAMMEALALSYESVGLGAATWNGEVLEKTAQMFGRIWETGLQTGGPVLLVMMLLSVVVGFVSRTMPQFNIQAVGLPAQTVVGMLALMLMMRVYCQAVAYLGHELISDLYTVVDLMAPQG